MAHGTNIDLARLRELVERGKSGTEIMTELDIRESALQQALQEVMRETTSGMKTSGETGLQYTESGERIPPAMAEESTRDSPLKKQE